jgi:NADPH2 dehydrogenase
LTKDEIQRIVKAFGTATQRAISCGFDVIEIHGAHGYLISAFNSPIVNKRTDEYGQNFEGRIRFCKEVIQEVKKVWGQRPLFLRISCVDWVEGTMVMNLQSDCGCLYKKDGNIHNHNTFELQLYLHSNQEDGQ